MEPMLRVKERPGLAAVAGKFMVVSQFGEPIRYDRGTKEFVYASFADLDDRWWAAVRPDIFDDRRVFWGHSTWFINHDGTLTFSGADYDST